MESFGFIPLSLADLPEVAGLTIRPISRERLADIQWMNELIFDETRIINTFDRSDLLILEARVEGKPAGFKIGYRENRFTYYSAKGGVLPEYRRRGIAVALLAEMMKQARARRYQRFAFDTFPNLHPGMTILALRLGFRIVKADFNSVYKEFRLRFEKKLDAEPGSPADSGNTAT